MLAQTPAVVIGTGRMAPGIASALAQAGAQVTVAGRSLDRAIRAAELAGVGVTARALEPDTFRDAHLVVETVTEDFDVKAHVYALVTPWLCSDAVLAWNRLQHALLREALWLVDQQVADIATVDAAVSDGLAPRWLAAGPFATADLGGMDTWCQVAIEIFPHLASDPGLAAALDEHAWAGTTFYEWDAGAQPGVADLRSRAIQMSRDVTVDRHRLTPPAAPAGTRRAPGDGSNRPAPLAQHAAALRLIYRAFKTLCCGVVRPRE